MERLSAHRLAHLRPALPTAAWVGFLGSCLIGIGRLGWWIGANASDHTAWARGIRDLMTRELVGAITFAGVAVLLVAWMLLRRELTRERPRFWTVFIAWAVPILPLAGILSSDARFYSDIGWMVSRGDDPYLTGLGTTGSPFPVGEAWYGTMSVYPPLAVRLMGLLTSITGAHWYWTVVSMRVLAMIGIGLLAWALPRLAARAGVDPRKALWLGIFNPLTFIHGFGGMHIDMLMSGVMAAALVLALRRRGLLWGALMVGVAASIKQPALLAAVPVALLAPATRTERWPRTIARTALSIVIAVGAMVAVSYACGFGTRVLAAAEAGATSMHAVKTGTVARMVSEAIIYVRSLLGLTTPKALFGSMDTVALVIAGVVVVVVYLRYRRRPFDFLAAASLAFILGSPAFREWYLLIWISFVGLATLGPWMRRAVSVLVPFAAVYGAFKTYLGWAIPPAFWAGIGVAAAANASSWLVGPNALPADQAVPTEPVDAVGTAADSAEA